MNPDAFALLLECVRQGGLVSNAEIARRMADLDLEGRIEALRFVDYYLLPGRSTLEIKKGTAEFKEL